MREMTNLKHISSLVRNIKSPPWPILHTSQRCNCCPSLDLEYYTNLLEYRNLHAPGYLRYCMDEAMINSLLRHTWMLTDEIVIFCLWDENHPVRVQRGVADKVMAAELPEKKPNLPKELGNNPNLQDLGGPCSYIFFWPLRIGTNWLAQSVRHWKNDSEYLKIQDLLKNLKVHNGYMQRDT